MNAIAPLRLPMSAPDDLAGFAALLDGGGFPARDVVALWCKTRGNGLLNDFTKPWVDLLLRRLLAEHLGCGEAEVAQRVPILVSGGSEGAVSPHLVIWRRGSPGPHGLLCAVERAEMGEDALGGPGQAEATAAMVEAARLGLGVTPEAVGLVLVRAPARSGAEAATRIACAQGAALALGEIPAIALEDPARFAQRAFVVARHDGPTQQVMLLANGPGGDPRFAVAHGLLQDPLDAPGAAAVLAQLGLDARPQLARPRRVVAAISKGDAPRGPLLRGLPHAMRQDDDLAMHRHARAAYGAMLGAIIGHGAVLVSGGAEAQGPPDGGFVSIIATTEGD
jgi:cyanuric acid amidohydrolase